MNMNQEIRKIKSSGVTDGFEFINVGSIIGEGYCVDGITTDGELVGIPNSLHQFLLDVGHKDAIKVAKRLELWLQTRDLSDRGYVCPVKRAIGSFLREIESIEDWFAEEFSYLDGDIEYLCQGCVINGVEKRCSDCPFYMDGHQFPCYAAASAWQEIDNLSRRLSQEIDVVAFKYQNVIPQEVYSKGIESLEELI